mgnify:FL=1|tara:strand:- start:2828 stop:3046 length:219 start_codon:yes stop_codon:yes gene_type:complete
MQYKQLMISYIHQLQAAADKADVSLLKAFKESGTPTSTFYRAINGTDLHLSTAKKVEDAIKVYALQKTATNL